VTKPCPHCGQTENTQFGLLVRCDGCGEVLAEKAAPLTSAQIDAQRRELEASWTSLSIPTPTPKATP